MAEINYLGQLHHPNFVKLIGYCLEDENRLLVYEFMARASMENHFFRRGLYFLLLPWGIQMKVALSAAKRLAFLHNAKTQVIYCYFKTSNILLDLNYNTKLSDFGLVRDGPTGDRSHVFTRVMGTYGYAAPEYLTTGIELATDKFLAFASQKVAVLVDDGNFLAWKQHMLLIVKTHRLQMFLNRTVAIPPRMVVTEGGISDENSLYVCYEQQDSALAAWLLSTISPLLHNQLVGNFGSSCELWQALMHIFGSHSTTKAMSYRLLLHNIQKK
ncbi:hypothetical protein V6Z11_A04G112500 [Gossypium hirsutum]